MCRHLYLVPIVVQVSHPGLHRLSVGGGGVLVEAAAVSTRANQSGLPETRRQISIRMG